MPYTVNWKSCVLFTEPEIIHGDPDIAKTHGIVINFIFMSTESVCNFFQKWEE